jgi:hypothetical protein
MTLFDVQEYLNIVSLKDLIIMSGWWDTEYSWAGKGGEYTCCKII